MFPINLSYFRNFLFFAPCELIFKVKSWLTRVKNSKTWKVAQINRGGGAANLQWRRVTTPSYERRSTYFSYFSNFSILGGAVISVVFLVAAAKRQQL